MKALVYEGPETIGFRDVADASPGAGEQLIRVVSSGICGSDMHAYLGHDERRPAPLILGHEAAGVIVGGARDGERVTINPLVNCGTCFACRTGRQNLCPSREIISMPPREGAFAEYVAMRDENLVSMPDGVGFDQAALAEPLAVSWHGARLGLEALGDDYPKNALVIGGGAIGVAAALALIAMGWQDVTLVEPNTARRKFLKSHFDFDIADEATGSFSFVVDAVGYAATRETASAHVRPGGVIVHIGLGDAAGGLDIRRMTLQEITFIGTYTYTNKDFIDTAQAIFDGRLGALDWVDIRPLSEGAQAFADLRGGKVQNPKIILRP